MRGLIALLFLLGCAGANFAQVADEPILSVEEAEQKAMEAERSKGQILLKLHPLGFLEPEGIAQVGLEYVLNPKTTVQLEAGYVYNGVPLFNELDGLSGYRVRGELRAYESPNFYIAVDLMFKNVIWSDSERVGRECTDFGNCSYWQDLEYQIRKRRVSYHIKLGHQDYLSKRLVYDVFFGAGLRHVRSDRLGLPDDAQLPIRGAFLFSDDSNYIFPSLTLGFKVGILLNKKS